MTRPLRLAVADLGTVTAAGVLHWAAGGPSTALALTAGRGPADAAVLGLVGLLAWACLGWIAAVVLTAHLALLPGVAGRVAAHVGRAVTPLAARRLLEVGLGVTLATGALGTLPAAADVTAPRPPAMSAPSLDWPQSTQPVSPLVVARPRPERSPDDAVVVRRGDTLWDIAARHLGPSATASDIAAAWPRWFAANRTVVGTDPDLILPGQRLTPPPPAR